MAALEAQLSAAQNRVPGHQKRQLREVRSQLEVLRSRNLQLREAVHLLRAAVRPSLASAVACVNVLAAAQQASGAGIGPGEAHGLAAGLQGLAGFGAPQQTPGGAGMGMGPAHAHAHAAHSHAPPP